MVAYLRTRLVDINNSIPWLSDTFFLHFIHSCGHQSCPPLFLSNGGKYSMENRMKYCRGEAVFDMPVYCFAVTGTLKQIRCSFTNPSAGGGCCVCCVVLRCVALHLLNIYTHEYKVRNAGM